MEPEGAKTEDIELGILYVTDQVALFDPNSGERATMLEYGKRVKELHIVVLTPKQNAKNLERIAPNVFLYPTNTNGTMGTIASAQKLVDKNCVWMSKLRANLIVASNPVLAGFIAMKLAKKYSKRLFVEYRGDFLAGSHTFTFRGAIRKYMIEKVLGRATRVLVSKAIFKDRVAGYLPNGDAQIAVVPTFINIDAFEKDPTRINFQEKYPGIAFMILVANDLVREQDVDIALDIAKDIIAAYPRTGMLILGEGPELANLKLRARRMGLSKNIFFEPMPVQFAPYARGASVLIATARVDDEHLSAVQALAASTPVIVTTANTVAGILKDTPYAKWICKVGDKECFKKNILELITGTAVRDDFRINAKYMIADRMKNFGGDHFEAMLEEWKNTFKNV